MAEVPSGTHFGAKAFDFTYNTPFEQGLKLSETVKQANKTFLIFLRYYGCTVCQLDLSEFRENYHLFAQKDAQILVVLQSEPENIAAQVGEGDIPFSIVCDPNQEIYKLYDVKAANSRIGLISLGTIRKVRKAKKLGFQHGAYEGNEYQLPAIFLMDKGMRISFYHRAKNLADLPTTEQLLACI